MAGPAGFEPATTDSGGCQNPLDFTTSSKTELLSKFKEFCRIDRNLSERTVSENNGYPFQVRRFLESVGKHPSQVTAEDVRSFLSKFQDRSASTRAKILKALKVFFRDFLKMPWVVESFKFPKLTYTPKSVPSKEDLQRFFNALDNLRDPTIFLMYATSGLRRNELLSLTVDEVGLENRLIIPKNAHNGTTKNTWATCFNEEAQTYLKRYLANRQTTDNRLFPISEVTLRRTYKEVNKKTGLYITPQVLRAFSLAVKCRLCVRRARVGGLYHSALSSICRPFATGQDQSALSKEPSTLRCRRTASERTSQHLPCPCY